MMTAEEYMATHTPLNNSDGPLTDEERRQWWEAMNEADRIHDYYKEYGRPLTLRQSMMEYENKRRILS